jgi:cysteine desulfurase
MPNEMIQSDAALMKLPIYLDYNATTPVDERVLAKMVPYFTTIFGNAASRHHAFGWDAQEAVEDARDEVARLINASRREIIFTSGATESVNLALKGVAEHYRSKGNHIITTTIEHRAVLDTCQRLETQGFEVTYLPVDHQGNIALDQLKASITPATIVIAVMYANNEIGTIQPIPQIGELAHKHGIVFFTDATQAVGKIGVDVHHDQIDLAAFSAHKIYGPKGVGALFVRQHHPQVDLVAQTDGGGHERGWRSGTLNVSGIVGFGEACRIVKAEMQQEMARLSYLRNKLEHALLSRLSGVYVNGTRTNRLPHVTNMSFRCIASKDLMAALPNIAVSSSAACTSTSSEPSYVIKALGTHDELAYGAIRFSLGRLTTEAEIDYTIDTMTQAVKRLQKLSSL